MVTIDETQLVGAYERVDFPRFGLRGFLAKIDTGADTGALHSTKVHEEEVEGEKVLFFSPFDRPELVESTRLYRVKYVKSSNGQREKRYFIETTIVIHGKPYPITLSLADRNQLKYPVLIGRTFLARNHLIVDVSKTEPADGNLNKGEA